MERCAKFFKQFANILIWFSVQLFLQEFFNQEHKSNWTRIVGILLPLTGRLSIHSRTFFFHDDIVMQQLFVFAYRATQTFTVTAFDISYQVIWHSDRSATVRKFNESLVYFEFPLTEHSLNEESFLLISGEHFNLSFLFLFWWNIRTFLLRTQWFHDLTWEMNHEMRIIQTYFIDSLKIIMNERQMHSNSTSI